MKSRLLILMIFVFSFNITDAQEINYEIKAYQGTIIEGCIFGSGFGKRYFGSMICDNDTVSFETSTMRHFLESLYSCALYIQVSTDKAYNILYPPKIKEDYIKNYELANDMHYIYRIEAETDYKTIKFALCDGLWVEFNYIFVKGLFLSLKDDESRDKFRISDDVNYKVLPDLKDYIIPLSILEYGPSEQVFIINGCYKDDSD